MTKQEMKELGIKLKAVSESVYEEGKAAIKDGFDWGDVETFGKLFEKIIINLDDLNQDLSLDDKKDFLVYFGLELYYQQKLPWWMRFIPKYFIKKNVKKYVDKVLDYLHLKGIIAGEDVDPE